MRRTMPLLMFLRKRRSRLSSLQFKNIAISASVQPMSARSSTCDASIFLVGIYSRLLVASIVGCPTLCSKPSLASKQVGWLCFAKSATPLLHLNVYGWRDVITLPRSLQSFELSKVVAEVLVRCCSVAQDSVQRLTFWNAEVVVDLGQFRTDHRAEEILSLRAFTF